MPNPRECSCVNADQPYVCEMISFFPTVQAGQTRWPLLCGVFGAGAISLLGNFGTRNSETILAARRHRQLQEKKGRQGGEAYAAQMLATSQLIAPCANLLQDAKNNCDQSLEAATLSY